MSHKKIGIGITTYNSESYYKELYDSLLPSINYISEIVTINGGDKYKGEYAFDWVQHSRNRYPSVCRNDAVSFLLNKGVDYIFLIEDDMIIKNPDVFKLYINAHERTGLDYFCYASTSSGSGMPFNRTPAATVEYPCSTKINFYPNMCNEFTFHSARNFMTPEGMYDSNMRDAFDVDMVYRSSKNPQLNVAPFWWFADIEGSDDLVGNNPNAVSRLQANGARDAAIRDQWKYFVVKYGTNVQNIPRCSQGELRNKLATIYKNK
jgi:glycosyltransferase involved in cell wall biosynthesis